MKQESSGREEEISLKQARLNMLLLGGDAMVDRKYEQVNDALLLFMATIDIKTSGGKEIRETYNKAQAEFNANIDSAETILHNAYNSMYGADEERQIMHGLPRAMWYDQKVAKAWRHFAMNFNTICWSIAHTHELIPSK